VPFEVRLTNFCFWEASQTLNATGLGRKLQAETSQANISFSFSLTEIRRSEFGQALPNFEGADNTRAMSGVSALASFRRLERTTASHPTRPSARVVVNGS
jgi:hypothetical protein